MKLALLLLSLAMAITVHHCRIAREVDADAEGNEVDTPFAPSDKVYSPRPLPHTCNSTLKCMYDYDFHSHCARNNRGLFGLGDDEKEEEEGKCKCDEDFELNRSTESYEVCSKKPKTDHKHRTPLFATDCRTDDDCRRQYGAGRQCRHSFTIGSRLCFQPKMHSDLAVTEEGKSITECSRDMECMINPNFDYFSHCSLAGYCECNRMYVWNRNVRTCARRPITVIHFVNDTHVTLYRLKRSANGEDANSIDAGSVLEGAPHGHLVLDP